MRMSRERCIGILLVLGVSCALTMLVLFVISPLLMLGVTMVMILLLAILWRIRPGLFDFLGYLKKVETEAESSDIDKILSREVFLSDMVLCSVNVPGGCSVKINKKLLVIGMAEGCDLVMPPDSGASRIHAKVFYSRQREQFLVEDNDSGAGTYLNGVRLVKGQPQILCKGDHLRFAGMEFVVKSAYYS